MHVIPQSWSHLHILVSVFPSVGLVFVLGFYIAAFATNSEAMKRICLLLFGALSVCPRTHSIWSWVSQLLRWP